VKKTKTTYPLINNKQTLYEGLITKKTNSHNAVL
jgi:hypothetical protein